jgi:hypothetical protein
LGFLVRPPNTRPTDWVFCSDSYQGFRFYPQALKRVYRQSPECSKLLTHTVNQKLVSFYGFGWRTFALLPPNPRILEDGKINLNSSKHRLALLLFVQWVLKRLRGAPRRFGAPRHRTEEISLNVLRGSKPRNQYEISFSLGLAANAKRLKEKTLSKFDSH